MRTVFFLTLGLASLVAQRVAHAHSDVLPYAYNGKIVTGGHDDVTLENTIVERVFGYDFGEEPSDPYFIGDPGFNNGAFAAGIFPNDGLLPANYTLGFDVLTTLQYWDGTGAVSFGLPPADVSLGLNKGAFTVTVDGTGQTGTAPSIGSTGPLGRLHVHLGSLLNSSDGTDPGDPNAPAGVYMLGLQLKLPGSGLANSDPFFLVYNNGLDEETHDLAMDWVDAHLAPEPSTWMLLATAAVGVPAFVRRKRRRIRVQS